MPAACRGGGESGCGNDQAGDTEQEPGTVVAEHLNQPVGGFRAGKDQGKNLVPGRVLNCVPGKSQVTEGPDEQPGDNGPVRMSVHAEISAAES